jgi:hypothetical protein
MIVEVKLPVQAYARMVALGSDSCHDAVQA